MAKDPAFLFYSKDWLEGTMELTAEEKGVYIDLLAHQHQKGSLPSETKRLCKLVGLSEVEFLPIWNGIKAKFKPAENDRIHNLKLTGVVTERLENGRKNKIIGIFAAVVRQAKKPPEQKTEAKKGFKVDDFTHLPDHLLTEKITEWFTERLSSLEDGNAIANEDAIKDTLGGVGTFYFDATELPVLALEAVEMNQFTHTKKKNTDFVKEHWRIFLAERMNDPPAKKNQYKSITDLTSYFFNWMRDKFPANGTETHRQFSGTGANKAGTSQARTDAAKKF